MARILLIEDNPLHTQTVLTELAETESTTATSVKDALQQTQPDKPWDAIFISGHLSKPNTPAWMRLLQASSALVVLVDHDDDPIVETALNDHALDCITRHSKPIRRALRCIARLAQSQRKLQQAESHLVQSHRLQTLGQLAGGVAHDFNNLTTALYACSDEIIATLEPNHPAIVLAQEIFQIADRSASLTRQLLMFCRAQPLAPKLQDINQLVFDTMTMLKRVIGADITPDIRLQPGLGLVRAPEGQIEQIVLNLVLNTRSAMPDGGSLILKTERSVRKETGGVSKTYVQLSIQGIAGQHPPSASKPFFATKLHKEGIDLGLTAVYQLVTQCGGEITVEDESLPGTCFTVFLPAATSTKEAPSHMKWTSDEGNSETILLVEDNDALRHMTRRALETSGYTVVTAANSEEAYKAMEESGSDLNLLITDIMLPEGENGFHIAQRAKTMCPNAAVLFVSGFPYQIEPDLQHDFLWKPFTLRKLVRTVSAKLSKHRRTS